LFQFSVDLSFSPNAENQEAGVVAFLTQDANIKVGVVFVGDGLEFRFKTEKQENIRYVPSEWVGQPIRLIIEMTTPDIYTFSAMLASDPKTKIELGKGYAELLSGNTGSFVGTLIGVYATCNGAGSGLDCPSGTPNAYFNRWRYTGVAQYISETEKIPSTGNLTHWKF
jgi:hypothetical protein